MTRLHPIFESLFGAMREQGLAPPDLSSAELDASLDDLQSEPLTERDALLLDDYACSLAGLPVPRAPVLDAERLAEAEQAQTRG